ncbi:MAG: DUF167 domain-containing protein [Candidatus Omnitrophota bacterium]|nr:DUF167 domain-containing protein [Candidatus Omnitrophota bacterium]
MDLLRMKINVKVFPKSSREELVEKDGVIKAYIKAAPDKGKANKALVALLARVYKVRKSDVKIITGQASRNKIVEIKKDG